MKTIANIKNKNRRFNNIYFLVIGLLSGIFIGVSLFKKYWQIQDYRMFPPEVVVQTDYDSKFETVPSIVWFKAKNIQDSLNTSFDEMKNDSIISRIIKKFNQVKLSNNLQRDERQNINMYLIEATNDNYKVLYDHYYLITRTSIDFLYKFDVITVEEFEKKYNRQYIHVCNTK